VIGDGKSVRQDVDWWIGARDDYKLFDDLRCVKPRTTPH
jgi:hypothetical protein